MIVYADTSGLAKLILQESGTTEMIAAIADIEMLASVSIAYVELRAALAAALRDGRIPSVERNHLIEELERLWGGVSEIRVDRQLVRQAGDLAEQMRLRGYDALHLAALTALGEPGAVVFAC